MLLDLQKSYWVVFLLCHTNVYNKIRLSLLLFTPFQVFPTCASRLFLTLSDSKSPQVSWTLLSILADLNNAVV